MTLKGIETMLRPVTMESQPLFEQYTRLHPTEVCQLTFPNIVLWSECRHHRYAEVEGHVVVCFTKTGETTKWYQPIGPSPETIIRDTLPSSEGFSWMYLDQRVADALGSSMPLHFEENHCDYVYTVKDLIELPGTRYANKRNYIRKLLPLEPEVITLSSNDTNECRELAARWLSMMAEPHPASALDNVTAFHMALDHFEQLGLIGIGVRVKGVLEAVAVGAPVKEGMFDEIFELTSNAHKGLYQFILHEFAKRLPSTYPLLNREEDVGSPSLREAKEGWHPVFMVKKYSIAAGA